MKVKFYHGTTKAAAQNIIDNDIDLNIGVFHMTTDIHVAKNYGTTIVEFVMNYDPKLPYSLINSGNNHNEGLGNAVQYIIRSGADLMKFYRALDDELEPVMYNSKWIQQAA